MTHDVAFSFARQVPRLLGLGKGQRVRVATKFLLALSTSERITELDSKNLIFA